MTNDNNKTQEKVVAEAENKTAEVSKMATDGAKKNMSAGRTKSFGGRRNGNGDRGGRKGNNDSRDDRGGVSEFEERVVQVSRVSKKTKGGNQMGFSIVVVVGDKKGQVGVGLGKGKDVAGTIKKAAKKAKNKMITVPIDGTTIPFAVTVKHGSARVILMPAPKGSGIIAGGTVRAVVEVAGIRDLSSKIMGTTNQASNVYATFAALEEISRLVKIKGLKLRSIAEIEAEEAAKLAALQEEAKQKGEEALKTDTTGAKKNVKKTVATKKEVKSEVKKVVVKAKAEVKGEVKEAQAEVAKTKVKKEKTA